MPTKACRCCAVDFPPRPWRRCLRSGRFGPLTRCASLWRAVALTLLSGIAAQGPAAAQMEEVVVVGDLGSLPGEDVQSIFGFGKSLLHTPRSASTVSEDMMARFDMRDIDELVAVAPGSFTQSFFGVAGSLDIRGTPGETYFRGVRRLDNPGNYPTPIGASDRIDIVRGPASPIYGPAKVGGYLNFNPKSARIEETGEFIAENTGVAGDVVLAESLKGEADWGYDAEAGEYGNLLGRGIMDPAKVTRAAIENSASVAAMVLTTESLISDIPEETPPMPPAPPMDY